MLTYISTRGGAPAVDFRSALLAGLAPDGGLYLPRSWPTFDREQNDEIAGLSFAEAASLILAPFTAPWLDRKELLDLCSRAYARFAHPQVAPLTQLGDNRYVLELFHGPTLAFKDVAMQLLGLLFERALAESGSRATIIGATSGDTGGAAVEAFRGLNGVEVVILHPHERISEVQRRFMTTTREANIRNLALEGSFDDCQSIVKAIFADRSFCERHAISGVNSINWARLAIQTVYYFTAIAALRRLGERRTPSFCVPTGNFGDVFAGYAAKKMGADIDRLIVAVNDNDIMRRALSTGTYAPQGVVATSSPSMDIQVASNFERLLFEASGRDAAAVRALMATFAQEGRYDIPPAWLEEMRRDFSSGRASREECEQTIARIFHGHGKLVDPHTAVALNVQEKMRAARDMTGPVVTLSTAHPAKFPDTVEAATGERPRLPDHVGDLYADDERYQVMQADVRLVKEAIEHGGRG